MAEIPLNKGRVALVDDDVYQELSGYKWYTQSGGYAVRNSRVGELPGPRRTIRMHRQIMGLLPGDRREVDHISGDILDNRRQNLRVCTHLENSGNQALAKNNHSGFKGVSWSEHAWRSAIKVQGRTLYLGKFRTPSAAAAAYNQAALRHFGRYARINQGVV